MQKFSKVFTLMVAMLALAYCAVSCKVNVDDEPTLYTVTVASSIEHGKVSVDKSSAEAGTTIKLTATADEGYQLDSYSVKDASSNAITVTDGTFTMPKSNVTVSATFTKTAATLNQEAADAVITKITAIGTVAYTTESKTKIDEARTAYDALTEAQKALIPAETLAVLTKAETDYNALKTSADEAAANQAAADAVIAKINAIGTVAYTTESKTKIDDARTAYDELTGAQKALIPAETLALLTAAEASYNSQKATADKANAVIAKITAIGTVTYTSESKAKIDEARTAYDALTEAQKALVPTETLALLTAAESTYAELKAAAEQQTANQNAANAVIAKITAIGTVAYTAESKAKIDEARTAYDALTEAQKALIPAETLALLTAAETKYAELKAAAEQQTAGSISYATTTVEKTTADGAFTNELNKTGDGTVTYASSDEAVATVNASTGEVTIVGAGTATITATVTDSASYTYATKTASYTLTVTVAVSSVIINNAPTEALFVNSTGTLTATVSPDNATDKTIVWSSSDPDYVSINAETGEYTIMGKKGYGSATITATAGDKTTTCTITGKVHHTSLQAGDIILVGETIYTGKTWYVNISPNTSFATSAGVITLVEADTNGTLYYKCSRGSNGTKPNWTKFKVADNTDGLYIVSGTGTKSDKFVFAVHTK